MTTPKTLPFVYAVTDCQRSIFFEPGYRYEVAEEDPERGRFRIGTDWQSWEKDGDIGFQDWQRVEAEEEVPPGVFELGLSVPEVRKVISILRDTREQVAGIDRDKHDGERAAFEYWFATAPRVGGDDSGIDPRDIVASYAGLDAGAYDAAKALSIESLESLDSASDMPPRLSGFAANFMRGLERPKPMRDGKQVRGVTDLRDPILIKTLMDLEHLGIDPTQNAAKGVKKPETDGKSTCGAMLVCWALKGVESRLNPSTLQKMWSNKEGRRIRAEYDNMPG